MKAILLWVLLFPIHLVLVLPVLILACRSTLLYLFSQYQLFLLYILGQICDNAIIIVVVVHFCQDGSQSNLHFKYQKIQLTMCYTVGYCLLIDSLCSLKLYEIHQNPVK